jgi:hypothetical protein
MIYPETMNALLGLFGSFFDPRSVLNRYAPCFIECSAVFQCSALARHFQQ